MVEILDTTLREGEQTPYVNFTVDEKIQIAHMLDRVGVDMIEAGDPSVSPNVATAIDKSKACGAGRVAIFYATSKIHLDVKLHKTQDEAFGIITDQVAYARGLGLKVRFTPEDATRTDFEFL